MDRREAREIAQEIRAMDTWDMDLLERLCALANMEEVANKAAVALRVELY